MSDVSKTNEALIAEAQEHYSEMNGLNSRAAEVMMELVAALEAKTGVRVDMSSAVGVETQLAATRVPVQGEPNDDREALADRLARALDGNGGDDLGLAQGEGALHLALDFPIREAIEDVYADCGDSAAGVLSTNIAQRLAYLLPTALLAAFPSLSRVTVPDAASAAIERVRLLAHQHRSVEQHNVMVPLSEIGDLIREPSSADYLAALDGAPEPEWEEVVQYGNLTSLGFIQETRGRNYAMHKRIVRFGPALPVEGESE